MRSEGARLTNHYVMQAMASASGYFQGDMASHDPTTCSFQQFLVSGSGSADKPPAAAAANAAATAFQGMNGEQNTDTPQHFGSAGSGAAGLAPAQGSVPGDQPLGDLNSAQHLYLAQAPIRTEVPGPAPLSPLMQDIHIPEFLPQPPSEINLWMSMRSASILVIIVLSCPMLGR